MGEIYSENANGSTVELRPNEEFEVSLRESRMGGYRWKFIHYGAPILKNEELDTPATNASLPGGSSSRSWRFTAQQTGSTQLRLQQIRSWDPNSPGREFRLNVNVKP